MDNEMDPPPPIRLRPTLRLDLDAVLEIERHAENRDLIAQWSLEDHCAAIVRPDREHWVIEDVPRNVILGYIISFLLLGQGFGVYVKRIAVLRKSIGIGRRALHQYLREAFARLSTNSACLAVYRTNERAQRSYRAIGFASIVLPPTERSRLQELSGGFPDDAVIMRVDARALMPPNPGLQPTWSLHRFR